MGRQSDHRTAVSNPVESDPPLQGGRTGQSIPARILIVDDDPGAIASARHALAPAAHELTEVRSAAEAARYLGTHPVDLIIADVRKTAPNGLDVLRASKTDDPDRPVILTTSHATVESAVAAINEGAFDYLVKPVDPEELRLAVERALERGRLNAASRRLMDELRASNLTLSRRVAELNLLHEVSTALSTTGEVRQLLHDILRLATGVIGAGYGSIMLADQKRGVLTVAAACGIAEHQIPTTSLPMGESIAGWVAANGEPLLIEDVEADPRFARRNRPQFETRSLICAPLKTPNAVVGVISLSDKRDAAVFTPDDLRVLVTLAVQAAMAIEDTEHYQQVRRQLGEVTALQHLSERLAEVERTDQMVQAVFACLEQVILCDSLQWWQWDTGDGVLRLEADTSHPIAVDATEKRVASVTPAALADPAVRAETIRSALSGSRLGDDPLTILTVAVRSAEQPLGVFALIRRTDRPFDEGEERLVQLVGGQAERIFDRQRALRNASRLVTMGQMISEISHDLRRPLTNIRGALQVLRGRLVASDETAEILRGTEEEVVHLAALITELVDFSNPTRYRTERRDLCPIVQRALTLIERAARKNSIEVVAQFTPVVRPVFCDENQLTEALLNVLMNAVEAMPSGGHLTVRVTDEPAFPEGEEFVTVSIADTGPGMTGNELARCFERYYTTKSTGTGLGLAIVERIVRAHDGDVRAESQPGVGTTFHLRFPVR